MKMLKFYLFIVAAGIISTKAYAQTQNGYKVNGITVAGGNGRGEAANQLALTISNKADFRGVCVDAYGNVYVADGINHRVQIWAPGATTGQSVADNLSLNEPSDVHLDANGNLYICDFANSCFYKYNLQSGTIGRYGSLGTGNTMFRYPKGIFVDKTGNVYVADGPNYRVQMWKADEKQGIMVAGGNGFGSGANQISPEDVCVDQMGNIYVSEHYNTRVQKWAPGANTATTVVFDHSLMQGLAIDGSGNLFVAELTGNCVKMFAPGDPNGVTVAGGNGAGNAANQLLNPTGICLDDAGNLYVVDNGNQRVQKFEKEGSVANVVTPKPEPVVVHVVPTPPVTTNPDPPVKVHDGPVAFATLDWQKPVADLSELHENGFNSLVDELPIKVKISSANPIDADRVRVQLNGNVIAGGGKMRTVDLKAKKTDNQYSLEYATTVHLNRGINELQLMYGSNKSEILKANYSPEKLNLYVLAMGTAATNLKFTQNDATDFANIFRTQQGAGKLFEHATIETLIGADAKALAMADKITELGSKQYGPNDVMFIFISSHGLTVDGHLKITGSDYKSTQIDRTTLDFNKDVLDVLKETPCKKFIFLDACHSGAGIAGGGKAAETSLETEFAKWRTASNSITIITSSSGSEQSWEDEKWHNGAFTKAIKEALLEKKCDINGDGIVRMDELFKYINERVPKLVREVGKTDDNNKPVTQTPKILNDKGNVAIYVYDEKH
jgi:sugar lactone lactonase YvrE